MVWYPRDSWIRFYIHHRNLYSKGYGEYSVVKQLFQFQTVMVGWLFLKSIWPELPNWIVGVVIPVVISGRVLVGWCLGWWWNKYKLFDRESDWTNARNPVLNGLDEKILKSQE